MLYEKTFDEKVAEVKACFDEEKLSSVTESYANHLYALVAHERGYRDVADMFSNKFYNL